jgi:hypothetical protein
MLTKVLSSGSSSLILPRSVMPRFILRIYEDVKDDLQWRTGVVLENKDFNSLAVINLITKQREFILT